MSWCLWLWTGTGGLLAVVACPRRTHTHNAHGNRSCEYGCLSDGHVCIRIPGNVTMSTRVSLRHISYVVRAHIFQWNRRRQQKEHSADKYVPSPMYIHTQFHIQPKMARRGRKRNETESNGFYCAAIVARRRKSGSRSTRPLKATLMRLLAREAAWIEMNPVTGTLRIRWNENPPKRRTMENSHSGFPVFRHSAVIFICLAWTSICFCTHWATMEFFNVEKRIGRNAVPAISNSFVLWIKLQEH